MSQTPRENPSRRNECRASWMAKGLRETIRIRDFAMRHLDRIYRCEYPRSSSFVFPPPVSPLSLLVPSWSDSGTKAASFEGGSKKKRVPTNTACNRVNCAAYAFISLFRDNLLIVSTKRDNPLVKPFEGRFFGSREGDLAVGAAQKGSICMRVNAPPFLQSPFLTTLTV